MSSDLKITNQQYLSLREIPVSLNRLYIPVINKGKPAIVKNRKAKDFVKYVHLEALRQKIKPLYGGICLKIDLLRKKGKKDIDIDNINKLLLDSMENICYYNDKQICSIEIRKHSNQDEDGINILISEIDDEYLKKKYSKEKIEKTR